MNSLESATLKNVPLGPKFPRKICQGHNLAESTKFKGREKDGGEGVQSSSEETLPADFAHYHKLLLLPPSQRVS